jgi:Cof subfamily protein (haloacid dehalogenase superfamily)
MYKIIASDLDGTLLSSEHKILPFTKRVLTQFHKLDKAFVFATGRHHIDVAQYRAKLGIPAFMISSNGACIHNCENEIVFQKNLSPEVISMVINMVKNDPELIINIYRNDDWLVNTVNEKNTSVHNNLPSSLFDTKEPPLENVAKIFLTHKHEVHEKLAVWEEQLKGQFSRLASITFSSPLCLEIMDVGVSKGSALNEVAKIKGYKLKDCIAFGDGMNDVEMLLMAGKGLLMGTSHNKVKDTLPHLEIINSCDEQAVAHYLVTNLKAN